MLWGYINATERDTENQHADPGPSQPESLCPTLPLLLPAQECSRVTMCHPLQLMALALSPQSSGVWAVQCKL